MNDVPTVDGVILVHGGTCAANIWDELLPFLSFPVVAVDLPGRGANPADLATVTLDDCVSTVIAAADAAGFARVALVGHSLGGLTITETAVRHPERVPSVVYVGALVPTASVSPANLMLGVDLPDGVMARMPEDRTRVLFGNDMDDAQWASVAARLVDEAYALMNARVSGHPLDAHRVFIGLTHDVPVPPALVDSMIGALGPDIDRRTIESGHMVMNSQPEALAAMLADVVRVA